MLEPKVHEKEKERLKELKSYAILDTLSETDYDNITAIAASICGTEISLISLIDDERQWFKSSFGVNLTETPREISFCAHAINDQENVFIVQDARKDERFHDNPLVTGDTNLTFYAGIPLISDNGLPLGTLCVMDHKPKLLSQSQVKSLRALGSQVMNILNLRKTKITLEKSLESLKEKNLELEQFAFIAAHDLKSPLNGINMLSQLISENNGSKLDDESKEMLSMIAKSCDNLKSLIDGLLEYSRSENVLKESKSLVNINSLINDMTGLFVYENNLTLTLKTSLIDIIVNRTALEQVLINLIANAIKYNDKEHVEIEIGVSESTTHYEFHVQDNGLGIALEYQEKIFDIFKVLENKDRFGDKGNGIGLATVKKVITNSGGTIKVISEPAMGARFIFTIEK
ncbi:sensor histidine kinase [Sediminicola sp. 1XM1-17]|uniref:sensor histidine kinase n=1 Tax=Sediminicola sp. 1XM1-17 TaxID=3127702 RepID=UPI0030782A13